MAFKKFNEYLDVKGKIPAVKVDPSGDQVEPAGGRDKKPPKSTKLGSVDAGGKVKKEDTTDNKTYGYGVKGKPQDDWNRVNSDLKYEPDTRTESFLKSTKDMTTGEFVAYMAKNYLVDEKTAKGMPQLTTPTGKFVPYPYEILPIARYLVLNNEQFMESFVRDIMRHDGLHALVSQLLLHVETFDAIGNTVGENASVARRLASLLEIVGPPKHQNIPDDDMGDMDDDDEDIPPHAGTHDDMGDEDDEDMDDDDEMGDEEGDDDMGDEDMGDGDEMGDGSDERGHMPMHKHMKPKRRPPMVPPEMAGGAMGMGGGPGMGM